MDYLNYGKQVKEQPQKPQPQGFFNIKKQQKPQPLKENTLPENVQLTSHDFSFGDLGEVTSQPPKDIQKTTQTFASGQTAIQNNGENPPFEVMELFPTALVIQQYPNDYSKELEFIKSSECRKHNGVKIENGSKQSFNRQSENTFVLDYPELVNIRNWISSRIDEYVRTILGSTDKLIITQSWFNKASKGESHHEHHHPNSIISGVWYPQIHEKLPPIMFRDSCPDNIQLQPKDFNKYNSSTFMLPMKMGELILFPSTLSHSVPENLSNEERISLSFNTWCKGNMGDIRSLTYLPLDRCV